MSHELQRVVVIGTSCCGKTTLASQLAQRLRCPHIELDALHWEPNWVEKPTEAFRKLVHQAVAPERWVVDGNYGTVRDVIWPRATAILWLNYSFGRVFGRTLTRTLRRAVKKEELYSGNRESLARALFTRDSILWWVISTFHHRRKAYRQLLESEQYAHIEWMEFRKPSEAGRFLQTVAEQRKADSSLRSE